MKTNTLLALAALVLGLAVRADDAVASGGADAAESKASTVLELSKQRVRIRTYDRMLAKQRECEAALKRHLKPEAEVARLPPNDRAVYDDQLARARKHVAEAKEKFAAHKATMTEDDFAKIAARDAAAKAARARKRR